LATVIPDRPPIAVPTRILTIPRKYLPFTSPKLTRSPESTAAVRDYRTRLGSMRCASIGSGAPQGQPRVGQQRCNQCYRFLHSGLSPEHAAQALLQGEARIYISPRCPTHGFVPTTPCSTLSPPPLGTELSLSLPRSEQSCRGTVKLGPEAQQSLCTSMHQERLRLVSASIFAFNFVHSL
jgi:hypothetical protein